MFCLHIHPRNHTVSSQEGIPGTEVITYFKLPCAEPSLQILLDIIILVHHPLRLFTITVCACVVCVWYTHLQTEATADHQVPSSFILYRFHCNATGLSLSQKLTCGLGWLAVWPPHLPCSADTVTGTQSYGRT